MGKIRMLLKRKIGGGNLLRICKRTEGCGMFKEEGGGFCLNKRGIKVGGQTKLSEDQFGAFKLSIAFIPLF